MAAVTLPAWYWRGGVLEGEATTVVTVARRVFEEISALQQSGPTDDLLVSAKLDEGAGASVAYQVRGEARRASAANPLDWESGVVAEKGLKTKIDNAISLPDAGDLERDQPFTISLWIKITNPGQNGAIVARMDNANDLVDVRRPEIGVAAKAVLSDSASIVAG